MSETLIPSHRLLSLAAISWADLARLWRRLPAARRRGRPCASSPPSSASRSRRSIASSQPSRPDSPASLVLPPGAIVVRPGSSMAPHPCPRPRPRCEIQELPLVVQRSGARALTRQARRGHVRRRSRQPERPASLSWLRGRVAVQRASARAGRRRVPRRRWPLHPRLREQQDRSRSRLASPSPPPGSRRARPRSPQGLARSPRPPPTRSPPRGNRGCRRRPSQSQAEPMGQLLGARAPRRPSSAPARPGYAPLPPPAAAHFSSMSVVTDFGRSSA